MSLLFSVKRENYLVSSDPQLLDFDVIHGYLSRSYWAKGVLRENVERATANSLAVGLYEGRAQIGFARVISDFTAFAYLADVFVLESHQGRGLGIWLVESIVMQPQLCKLKKWQLVTADAHELYRKFGFTELAKPEMHMERVRQV